MTSNSTPPEALGRRFRRVRSETGFRGLAIRGFGRILRMVADGLERVADATLTRTPPAWFTTLEAARLLAQNAVLLNRHAGERCFILGNGPSVRLLDLSPLASETVITVNQGHFYARERGLKPRYHAAVDVAFVEPPFDTYVDTLAALQREIGTELLLSELIGERLKMRRPEARSFVVRQYLVSSYFDSTPLPLPIDPTQAMPGFLSVIHFSIAMALAMGFTRIHLVGCDLSFFLTPRKTFIHSYEASPFQTDNAATCDLWGGDQVELMAWCLREFQAFAKLDQTARLRGTTIVNSGQGGALEVFPRQPLTDVFSDCP